MLGLLHERMKRRLATRGRDEAMGLDENGQFFSPGKIERKRDFAEKMSLGNAPQPDRRSCESAGNRDDDRILRPDASPALRSETAPT